MSDFQREYLVRLPLPLAQLYGRAHNAKDARGRHDNTFYLFEALVKLTAAPAVAGYLFEVQHGGQRVPELDRMLAQLALPSFGQWLDMLRELARHFGRRADAAAHPLGHLWRQLDSPRRDLPAVLALYRRIKNGPDGQPGGDQHCTLLQLFDALVQYRNGVFGHGAGRFDAFYEREMGPLLLPAANELLADGVLDLLGPRGSQLVYVTELRAVDEDREAVGLMELVGREAERMAPLELAKTEVANLAPNCVAVVWPGRRAPLRLDPLLVFRGSELAEEVLFLNRDRNGRQAEYLSYTTGRTERDKSMGPQLSRLLSQITGRAVSEAELEQLGAQTREETAPVEFVFAPTTPATEQVGDYEILAEIGRGAMGIVYVARQLSLGRIVALKMLPAELSGDEVALARFRREMRALGRCEHPHIVKVLANGTLPDGRQFYAMEYVPGADLEMTWRELAGANRQGDASSLGSTTWARAVLNASRKQREQTARRAAAGSSSGGSRTGTTSDVASSETQPLTPGPSPTRGEGSNAPDATADSTRRDAASTLPLPPLPELPNAADDPGGYARRVAMLIRDAALALQTVHEQGIVHRDVKPANLMLTPDGMRIVLMDFGLAKGQSLSLSASKSGGLLGTLRYAAPEQLAARSLVVGPAVDVRGLGVTMWELLTRQRLFGEAEDEKQLAALVHDQDVPRLSTIDPTLGPDLEAIVARATERRAADRIATAGQLAEYLQLYLDHKPLPIRPPSTAELMRRWVWEHKTLVGSTAAGIAIVVLTVVIALISVTAAKNDAVNAYNEAVDSRNDEKKAKDDAIESKKRAVAAAADAERQARQANSIRLAAQSREALKDFPQRSLLLAVEAIRVTDRSGEPPLPQANQALRDALTFAGGRPVPWYFDLGPGARRGPSLATGGPDGTVRVFNLLAADPATPAVVLHSRTGPIAALAVSDDRHWLVTASADDKLRLWDLTAKDPLRSARILPGFDAPGPNNEDQSPYDLATVISAAIEPSGHWLVTRSQSGQTRLWNLTARNPSAASTTLPGTAGSFRFGNHELLSHDGRWLLTSAPDATAYLWDLAAQDPTASGIRIGAGGFGFSNAAMSWDDRYLATMDDNKEISIWDLKGQNLATPALVRHGAKANATTIALSPNGRWLVATGPQKKAVLWDLSQASRPEFSLRDVADFNSVEFSPDSHWLASFGEGAALRLWDLTANDGENTRSTMLRGHDGLILDMLFSPDGQWLATGGADKTICLWDLKSATTDDANLVPTVLRGHEAGTGPVTFSPNSRWLVTATETEATMRMWDIAARSFSSASEDLPGPTMPAMRSSDYFGERMVAHWAERPIAFVGAERPIGAGAVTPDGRWLIAPGEEGTTQLWDLKGSAFAAAPIELAPFSVGAGIAAVSPDSRWLVIASRIPPVPVREIPAPILAPQPGPPAPAPAAEAPGASAPPPAPASPAAPETPPLLPPSATPPPPPPAKTATSVRATFDSALALAPPVAPPAPASSAVRPAPAPAPSPAPIIPLNINDGPIAPPPSGNEPPAAPPSAPSPAPSQIPPRPTDGPAPPPAASGTDDLPGTLLPVPRPVVPPAGPVVAPRPENDDSLAVALYDLKSDDPSAPTILPNQTGRVGLLAISPNSRWLAIESANGESHLWDLAAKELSPISLSAPELAPAPPAPAAPPPPPAAAAQPHFHLAAFAPGQTRPAHARSADGTAVGDIVFSADSRWVVTTAAGDGSRCLWDLSAKDIPFSAMLLLDTSDGNGAVVISPDSRWLITYAAPAAEVETAPTAPVPIPAPAVKPEPPLPAAPEKHADVFRPTATGRLANATAAGAFQIADPQGGIHLYDLTAKDVLASRRTLRDTANQRYKVLVSPDSHWLVVDDGTSLPAIRLWNLTAPDPSTTGTSPPPNQSNRDWGHLAAISSDSRWLITSSDPGGDSATWLWRLTAQGLPGMPIVLPGVPATNGHQVDSPVSADGRWLVTIQSGSLSDFTLSAWLWDLHLADPSTAPLLLARGETLMRAAAASSDSRWLLTDEDDAELGGGGHTARLWDLSGGDPTAELPIWFRAAAGETLGLAISPDNHWLIRSSDDRGVLQFQLWNRRVDELTAIAQSVAGRQMTPQERRAFAVPYPGNVIQFDAWQYKADDHAAVGVVGKNEIGPVRGEARLDSLRAVGFFGKDDFGGWQQTQEGKTLAYFTEVGRTAEYVELHDESRNLWVRLTATQALSSPDRTAWTVIETGSPTTPEWAHARPRASTASPGQFAPPPPPTGRDGAPAAPMPSPAVPGDVAPAPPAPYSRPPAASADRPSQFPSAPSAIPPAPSAPPPAPSGRGT